MHPTRQNMRKAGKMNHSTEPCTALDVQGPDEQGCGVRTYRRRLHHTQNAHPGMQRHRRHRRCLSRAPPLCTVPHTQVHLHAEPGQEQHVDKRE